MIIQSIPNVVSIAKEYMSVYDESIQNTSAYPQPEGYDQPTNSYTDNRTVVSNMEAFKYGMYYSIYNDDNWYWPNDSSFGSSKPFRYVLSPNVQEWACDSIYMTTLAPFDPCYLSSSTDSETGVTTTKWAAESSIRKGGMFANKRLVIQNPNMIMTADYPANGNLNMYGGKDMDIEFDFPDGVNYSSTFLDKIVPGTGSKATYKYTIYLDHAALKNAIANKVDSYTTITFYHLDGTEWS